MERRQLLQSLALGSLAATPALAADAARITVTDLEIFTVKVNRRGNWLFTRLRTSAGVHGIGEASHGKDELVVTLLRRFFERLKGRGIFDIEWLRQAVEIRDCRARCFRGGGAQRPRAVPVGHPGQGLWRAGI